MRVGFHMFSKPLVPANQCDSPIGPHVHCPDSLHSSSTSPPSSPCHSSCQHNLPDILQNPSLHCTDYRQWNSKPHRSPVNHQAAQASTWHHRDHPSSPRTPAVCQPMAPPRNEHMRKPGAGPKKREGLGAIVLDRKVPLRAQLCAAGTKERRKPRHYGNFERESNRWGNCYPIENKATRPQCPMTAIETPSRNKRSRFLGITRPRRPLMPQPGLAVNCKAQGHCGPSQKLLQRPTQASSGAQVL